MKYHLVILLLFALPCSGQTDSSQKANQEEREMAEQMPEFPGGQDSLIKFLKKNITYPAIAREMGISGTCYISFVVGPTGALESIRLLRGIRPPTSEDGKPLDDKRKQDYIYAARAMDEEALRVVRMMPDWKPGYQAGKAVKVRFNLPIRFKLT